MSSSSILTGASGGGRTYGFDFDLIKSPSPSIRSTTSSTSSTISESTNSPLAISTRKSRAPRKRPNQTYNEAASLLSTAYPNLFPNKKNPKNHFSKPSLSPSNDELFLPFSVFNNFHNSSFLLQNHQIQQHRPPKLLNLQENSCQSPGEIISGVNSLELNDDDVTGDEFDAESILDGEIDEGIDSIIGRKVEGDSNLEEEGGNGGEIGGKLGFGELGLGFVKAIRGGECEEGNSNWWNFAAVDVLEISPRIIKANNTTSLGDNEKKEKKKKTVSFGGEKKKTAAFEKPRVKVKSLRKITNSGGGGSKLMLKLNYENVISEWSDRGSPYAQTVEKKGNVSKSKSKGQTKTKKKV